MPKPEYGTEEYRQYAVLFNDITRAPRRGREHFLFSQRNALTEYLWAQGWRRDVRPEDVTPVTIVDEVDHLTQYGHLYPPGVANAADCCAGVCVECGNDDQCHGYRYCSDCLEELGHAADN